MIYKDVKEALTAMRYIASTLNDEVVVVSDYKGNRVTKIDTTGRKQEMRKNKNGQNPYLSKDEQIIKQISNLTQSVDNLVEVTKQTGTLFEGLLNIAAILSVVMAWVINNTVITNLTLILILIYFIRNLIVMNRCFELGKKIKKRWENVKK